MQLHFKQECIPVGCLQSAAVAVSGGGDVCPRGCLPGGSAWGEGVSAGGQGVSAQGGVCQTPPSP